MTRSPAEKLGAATASPPRLYFDNAATSWPKPEAVYQAVDQTLRQVGAAAGRGGYQAAQTAATLVHNCRRRIAERLHAETADTIVLTSNGTAALNLALHGVLEPGDHVVTTATEHNSVLRPLAALQQQQGIEWDCIPCDAVGHVAAAAVLAAVRQDTKLVVVSHASNVTGAVQPLAAIGEGLRDSATLFLCDAAQTLGYLPLDVQQAGIDLLAAPGHKGLQGPLGTGLLYVGPRAASRIRPTIQGGTGGQSDQLTMPASLPDRLEAGNLNVPAIAGLLVGLDWLAEPEGRQAEQRLTRLARQLRQGLQAIEPLQWWMAEDGLPLASLAFPTLEPAEVAAVLDTEFNIQVRSGWHCAARIHPCLGSAPAGTVRLSAGHHTTAAEVEQVLEAVAAIAAVGPA
jgi:cysteine desulfurase family protein